MCNGWVPKNITPGTFTWVHHRNPASDRYSMVTYTDTLLQVQIPEFTIRTTYSTYNSASGTGHLLTSVTPFSRYSSMSYLHKNPTPGTDLYFLMRHVQVQLPWLLLNKHHHTGAEQWFTYIDFLFLVQFLWDQPQGTDPLTP
jgi:hypothetical protein